MIIYNIFKISDLIIHPLLAENNYSTGWLVMSETSHPKQQNIIMVMLWSFLYEFCDLNNDQYKKRACQ